jgi:nitrogen fixation protein FixH
MSAQAQASFEIRGWHVLLGIVAFFGVVIAVDVGFAIQAYRTFPGEVSATPYEDGLTFNRTLARRAEERSLGWRAKVQASVLGAGSNLRSGRVLLRVTINDAAGQPVRGLRLTGKLERPATEAGELSPRFTETRPGIYEATAPDTPGAWDVSLTAVDAQGRAFDAESRMVWR